MWSDFLILQVGTTVNVKTLHDRGRAKQDAREKQLSTLIETFTGAAKNCYLIHHVHRLIQTLRTSSK